MDRNRGRGRQQQGMGYGSQPLGAQYGQQGRGGLGRTRKLPSNSWSGVQQLRVQHHVWWSDCCCSCCRPATAWPACTVQPRVQSPCNVQLIMPSYQQHTLSHLHCSSVSDHKPTTPMAPTTLPTVAVAAVLLRPMPHTHTHTALGSGPTRSSGGLTSLGLSGAGAGSMGASGGGAGGAGGAGGRGAGPDHREVRYAEGVLAMINVLRVLTLGGPRITDAATLKQVGGCVGWGEGCWHALSRCGICDSSSNAAAAAAAAAGSVDMQQEVTDQIGRRTQIASRWRL